jgi:hypothetical protein
MFVHWAAGRGPAPNLKLRSVADRLTNRAFMPNRTPHIRGFLQQSDALSAIVEEIQRRERLLAQVRRMLPDAVQLHCRQATLEAGRLTLSVDSPAWIDRLRFLSPQLMDALKRQGVEVCECRLRVIPDQGPLAALSEHAIARPGPTVARHLNRAADCIGSPALAESLRRLASHFAADGGNTDQPASTTKAPEA